MESIYHTLDMYVLSVGGIQMSPFVIFDVILNEYLSTSALTDQSVRRTEEDWYCINQIESIAQKP